MTAIDKLISVAEAEIGYLEKKSNKDLDSKTGNAGSNNYTKYNRDLKAWTGVGYINQQWCQAWVDWVFITAFGLDVAKKLIYTWTNYTPTGSSAFKKRDRYIKRGKGKPKRGDVIYFYSSSKGRIGHVGIVYKVSGSKVYTIEGNTSGASTLVTNGGGVKKKSYSMSSSYIDGYGSVDYSQIDGSVTSAPAPASVAYELGDRILSNGSTGADVAEMQKNLISLGYSCGSWGADGDFGDATEQAVRKFQAEHPPLDVDGEYGPLSHAAMLAALKAAAAPKNPRKIKIIGGNCYVRSAPVVKDGNKLGIVYEGTELEYQGQTDENGWHLVIYNGQNAWVSGKYGKLVDD